MHRVAAGRGFDGSASASWSPQHNAGRQRLQGSGAEECHHWPLVRQDSQPGALLALHRLAAITACRGCGASAVAQRWAQSNPLPPPASSTPLSGGLTKCPESASGAGAELLGSVGAAGAPQSLLRLLQVKASMQPFVVSIL